MVNSRVQGEKDPGYVAMIFFFRSARQDANNISFGGRLSRRVYDIATLSVAVDDDGGGLDRGTTMEAASAGQDLLSFQRGMKRNGSADGARRRCLPSWHFLINRWCYLM